MKPSYIILTESGERLYIADAIHYNPTRPETYFEWASRKIGFCFCKTRPNESYCFTPDQIDEPVTAHTVLFEAYDESGKLICKGSDHITQFWL